MVATVLKGNLRYDSMNALVNVEWTITAMAARMAAGSSLKPLRRGMVAIG